MHRQDSDLNLQTKYKHQSMVKPDFKKQKLHYIHLLFTRYTRLPPRRLNLIHWIVDILRDEGAVRMYLRRVRFLCAISPYHIAITPHNLTNPKIFSHTVSGHTFSFWTCRLTIFLPLFLKTWSAMQHNACTRRIRDKISCLKSGLALRLSPEIAPDILLTISNCQSAFISKRISHISIVHQLHYYNTHITHTNRLIFFCPDNWTMTPFNFWFNSQNMLQKVISFWHHIHV
jgi:hypothetical protein